MGAELLEDQEVSRLCDECSEATGLDLRRLLTTAGDEELTLTQHTQPCLVLVGVGLSLIARRRGLVPVAVAGHSVGEYCALAVAGVLSPVEAVLAVAARGRLMSDAVPAGLTSLYAVLGLAPEAVTEALADIDEVWPANFNTPTQTVIGGSVEGLERAADRLRRLGARRVLPLNVSAAFHTPFMRPAAARLRAELDRLQWRDPRLPVISNVTGGAHSTGATIPSRMEEQLRSPVNWMACVGSLSALGCDTYLELGPRRALTGMMRELAPAARAVAAGTPAALAEVDAAG